MGKMKELQIEKMNEALGILGISTEQVQQIWDSEKLTISEEEPNEVVLALENINTTLGEIADYLSDMRAPFVQPTKRSVFNK